MAPQGYCLRCCRWIEIVGVIPTEGYWIEGRHVPAMRIITSCGCWPHVSIPIPDTAAGSISRVACSRCGERELWWLCANHYGRLLAVCPKCFALVETPSPQACPDEARHDDRPWSACASGHWLGVQCVGCLKDICICHRAGIRKPERPRPRKAGAVAGLCPWCKEVVDILGLARAEKFEIVTSCGCKSYARVSCPNSARARRGVACRCGERKLWWFCASHYSVLFAACPKCLSVIDPNLKPKACPERNRHSCCSSWLAKEDKGWLGVICVDCCMPICICHESEAPDCAGSL